MRAKLSEIEKKMIAERYQAEVAALKGGELAAKNNLEAKRAYAEAELEIAKQKYGGESKAAIEAASHVAEIQRAQAAQAREIADIRGASARDAALADVDTQERASKTAYDLKSIDLEQLLILEQSYEDRRYAIRQAAAQRALGQLDPQSDPVAYEKQLAEIEKLRIQHETKMQEITLQGAKAAEGPWRSVLGAVGTSFEQTVRTFLKGTMTIRDAFLTMASSVLSAVVDVFAKIAAQWAITEAMQILGVGATAGATVSAAASEAGASGVASMAAAPFPLNLSAPEFGDAMFAKAAAFSAAGGFDIPAGVNPVTQLHAREMVLPAHIADPLRQQLANGGSGGEVHVHFNFETPDPRASARWVKANASIFVDALRGAGRNFAV